MVGWSTTVASQSVRTKAAYCGLPPREKNRELVLLLLKLRRSVELEVRSIKEECKKSREFGQGVYVEVAKMKRWLLLLPALALALLLLPQFGEAKIGDVSKGNTLKATEDELEGSADHEDDDDYFDDDYDDEGSGQYAYDDEEADLIPDEEDTSSSSSSKTTEFPPFGSSETELDELEKAVDDFHFEEGGKSGVNDNDDGELYEYYNEEYEPEYDNEEDDDDDDYDDDEEDARRNNRVLYRAESDIVVTAASDESDSGSFDLAYLYIMLASAFVSFALALATFFLCRSRSLAERQRVRMKKRSTAAMAMGQPFTVITPPTAAQFRQSSIVKSYQRVPTSTREFLEAPPPAYSAAAATTIDMAAEQNREPLLPDEQ